MEDRARFVEELGFDWVSLSEHHYSPRILTPSPAVAAAWLAGRVNTIKIALLGPIVPTSNPIRVAEEFAMLDALAPRRIVAGLLRGTHQRIPELRPERRGSAGTHRRGHGTDRQSLDRTGAVRVARAVFPAPGQFPPGRGERCRACNPYVLGTSAEAGSVSPPVTAWASVCRAHDHSRAMGRASRILPAAMRGKAFGWTPGPGRHHLPRQHDPGRIRRRGRRDIAAPRQSQAPFPIPVELLKGTR